MKKAVLSFLLVTTSFTIFAQNWVDVGVDTSWGSYFIPTQLISFHDSAIYLAANSQQVSDMYPFEWQSGGFFKSLDLGITWDTLHYFNESFYFGYNYQIVPNNERLYVIKGIEVSYYPPSYPQLLRPNASNFGLFDMAFDRDPGNLLYRHGQLTSGFGPIRYQGYLAKVFPFGSKLLLGFEKNLSSSFDYNPECYLTIVANDTVLYDSIVLPLSIERVHELCFVDSSRGYLAGGSLVNRVNGALLYTLDGGANWGVMMEAQLGKFYTVAFFDRDNGVLGGTEGIYFTRNGGFDWLKAIGIPSRFTAIDAAILSNGVGYMIGAYNDRNSGINSENHAQIYKTLDYGKEWCLVFNDSLPLAYMDRYEKEMFVHFNDENHGVAAYGYNRLLRTTNGGGLTECVTGINEAENELMVSVYPNPSAGSFTIAMPHALKVKNISVYDLSGSVVFQSTTPSSSVLVNGLSSGMYILQVQTNEGVNTQKVIVE